jgi:tetratricopeptide (TPR) repeat protein
LAAVQLALIEAHFGFGSRGRRRAAESLKLLPSNIDLGSLALAVAGDYVAAQESLDHLLEAFPEDTLLKNVIAPVVAAQANLNHGHPDRAIDLLRSAQPYEFGADNAGRGLMTIYLRGEAHLQMHAGKDAATEFQKIIDHPGIDAFSPLHALAYLGRARAYALDDDHTRARDAYQEFFSRWKDADVDLPILAQSRAEYAKLH